MPPRQPAKPRTAATRRPARRTAPAMAATALAEVAATLKAAPQPRRAGGSSLSPYPDLSMAIHMLEVSLKTAKEEKQYLLQKWISTLVKVQNEMQALHKLEILKNRLKSVASDAGPST